MLPFNEPSHGGRARTCKTKSGNVNCTQEWPGDDTMSTIGLFQLGPTADNLIQLEVETYLKMYQVGSVGLPEAEHLMNLHNVLDQILCQCNRGL